MQKGQTMKHPVNNILWVSIEKIVPNNYNPNSIAKSELKLLYISIKKDGYTQPIVTVYDKKKDKYIIIDGFNRYYVCKKNKDISDDTGGKVPIVVIDKDINNRMASTVRHNRARGKNNIIGMTNIVFKMLENGWEDWYICNELGMTPEELLRLKHITGFSKLFENIEYSKAWETKRQILLRRNINKRNDNPCQS